MQQLINQKPQAHFNACFQLLYYQHNRMRFTRNTILQPQTLTHDSTAKSSLNLMRLATARPPPHTWRQLTTLARFYILIHAHKHTHTRKNEPNEHFRLSACAGVCVFTHCVPYSLSLVSRHNYHHFTSTSHHHHYHRNPKYAQMTTTLSAKKQHRPNDRQPKALRTNDATSQFSTRTARDSTTTTYRAHAQTVQVLSVHSRRQKICKVQTETQHTVSISHTHSDRRLPVIQRVRTSEARKRLC